MLGMRQKIFMGLSCVHAINMIIQTVSFASYIYPVLLPQKPILFVRRPYLYYNLWICH